MGCRSRRGPRAAALTTASRPTATTSATTAATAAMFGTATRILVRRILAALAALRARRMGAFFDFERRRRQELDCTLQQLLDVTQQRDFVR